MARIESASSPIVRPTEKPWVTTNEVADEKPKESAPTPTATPPPLTPSSTHAPGEEIVEKRTANSKTFAGQTPNRFTSDFYPSPIHFKDEATGAWREIDPTLEAGNDGRLRPRAMSRKVNLSQDSTDPQVGRIEVAPDISLSFAIDGAGPSRARHSKDEATYPDVLPNADVELKIVDGGVKGTIDLRNRGAPDTYLFPLKLEGLTAEEKGGEVVFRDGDGDIRLHAPKGWMEDANVDPHSGVGKMSGDVTPSLAKMADGRQALKLTLDRSWLNASARVYPVHVDPTFTYYADSDDTFVQNTFPTTNYSANVELRAGTFNSGTDIVRSVLDFDTMDSAIAGKVINQGFFKLWNMYSYSCTSKPMKILRITDAWSGSTLQWPGPSVDPTVLAEPSFAKGYSASCPADWQVTDIKSTVVKWANGTWANRGLELRASDEFSSLGWKKFNSSNAASNRPHVWVDWSEPNTAPTVTVNSPATGYVGQAAPPLVATYNDSADWGQILYRVYDSNGALADSHDSALHSPGAQLSWTPSVPDGLYTWKVQAFDGELSSAWSTSRTFRVDSVDPAAPSTISSSTHTPYVPSSNASITVSWPLGTDPAPSSGIAGYATVFNTSATTPAGTTVSTTGTSQTSTVSSDGNWYFHVRTIDNAGNVSADRALGPIYIDTSAPFLGRESWWQSYDQRIGPEGVASVNPANGNLVVQQMDSTPIQAHGRLGIVVRRSYNSQDLGAGVVGTGWRLNVSETGDLAGLAPNRLSFSGTDTVTSAAKMRLIDRDGTRHLFTPQTLTTMIQANVTTDLGTRSPLRPVAFASSVVDSSAYKVCVTESYSAPAGVHLSLWRWIRIPASGACTAAGIATSGQILGFGAMRPDRTRYEFGAKGELLSIIDASGNELRYDYAIDPAPGITLGVLDNVFEKTSSCTTGDQSGCRKIHFDYDATENTVNKITECLHPETGNVCPIGRITTYEYSGTYPNRVLTKVNNPNGSHLEYAYGGCNGTATQLCKARDPNLNWETVDYETPPSGYNGSPRILHLTDRTNAQTTFEYASYWTYARPSGGHQILYNLIDARGRVAQVHEGDMSEWLRSTFYTWDSAGCRQPSAATDNNLCRVFRDSKNDQTPDEDTSFVYNAEGQLLAEKRINDAAPVNTTYGYAHQYVPATGATVAASDVVAGSGAVTSGARPAASLFVVSDRTQSLTPRGNAAGASFSPYLTTYRVDNNSSVAAGSTPSGDTCADPQAPVANTGDLCEVEGPSFDPARPTVKSRTRYTYNTRGERITLTTPKAMDEDPSKHFLYSYFAASDSDLSGDVTADGWLRGVTDPGGHFVAFGYDRAGNAVRTWDRNATRDTVLTDYPGGVSSPPNLLYTEQLYATGAASAAVETPWRYVVSARDQLGNTTTSARDDNGNPLTLTPARGVVADNADFDVEQTFNERDQLRTMLTPAGREDGGKVTERKYDGNGNLTSFEDPEDGVTVYAYDAVNRSIETRWSRGPGPSAIPTCHDSTGSGADSPIPEGRTVCSTTTSYDGVDNVIASQDGEQQTTTYTLDAVHREISRQVPRDGPNTTFHTDRRYDPDGHAIEICLPREFTEGPGTCDGTGSYSTQLTYDDAGRVRTQKTHRQTSFDPAGPFEALTTTTEYDGDGNITSATDANGHVTTATFDLNDRRATVLVPRTGPGVGANETAWHYDPAGNVTALERPGGRTTAYKYDDANRPVVTVIGADDLIADDTGLPSADGGKNIRSSVIYDPAGNVVARFAPRAFQDSVTDPDPRFMVRTDFDTSDRPTTQFVPRFDSGAHDDPTATESSDQDAQCSVRPAHSALVPDYPAGVETCETATTYFANDRAKQVTLPTAPTSANRHLDYTWTDDGLLSTVDAPSPKADGDRTQTTFAYDGVGRQLKATRAAESLGLERTTAYFSDGLVRSVTDEPAGTNTHVTTFAYDATGDATQVTDAMAHVSKQSYYSDGLTRDRQDPGANTTRYDYDDGGNVVHAYSPSAVALGDDNNTGGVATTYTYTQDNLVDTVVEPVSTDGTSELRRTTNGYDDGGRKTSQHVESIGPDGHGDGGTQSFEYSDADRLMKQTARLLSGQTEADTIDADYDADGNVETLIDTTGGGSTITSSYYLDSLPRTVSDGTRTTRHVYDGAGAPVIMQERIDAGGSTVDTTTHAYDDAGLAKTTTSARSGEIAFGYDETGRPTSRHDADAGLDTTSLWNADDTLSSHTTTRGTDTVAAFSYDYDGLRRITSQDFVDGEAASGGTLDDDDFSFDYDPAGRLDSFTAGTATKDIDFDADGNRTIYGAQHFTYRADDSIKTATDKDGNNEQSFDYEPFGGVQQDRDVTYGYDGFDRTTLIDAPGAEKATFTYDGNDRQRSRSYTDPDNSTESTDFFYDAFGSTPIVERKGGVDTGYTTSPGAGAVTASKAGEVQHLEADGQGNVSSATDGSGDVVCTLRYDPYGSPLGDEDETDDNPCDTGSTLSTMLYRGAHRDSGSGTYQLGSRTYAPGLGGFLTPDAYRAGPGQADLSVGVDPLTRNRYSYVNGDPINLIDPFGHRGCGWNPASWGACAGNVSEFVLGSRNPGDFGRELASKQTLSDIKRHAVSSVRSVASAVRHPTKVWRALEEVGAQRVDAFIAATGDIPTGLDLFNTAVNPAYRALDKCVGGATGRSAVGCLSAVAETVAVAIPVAQAVGIGVEAVSLGIEQVSARIAELGGLSATLADEAGAITLEGSGEALGAETDAAGGLFRIGEAGEGGPSLPMTHETVASVGERGGVGLEGVDVNIIKDPDLAGQGLYGYTHPGGGAIDLYPDAFESEESLVRTLGHERMHVFQNQIFGPVSDSVTLAAWERAAYGAEEDFVRYWQGGGL